MKEIEDKLLARMEAYSPSYLMEPLKGLLRQYKRENDILKIHVKSLQDSMAHNLELYSKLVNEYEKLRNDDGK